MSRHRCFGNAAHVHHVPGCRPARPLCRWMRRKRSNRKPCRCDAYYFPHRNGSGACRLGVPAAILRSPSWRGQVSA